MQGAGGSSKVRPSQKAAGTKTLAENAYNRLRQSIVSGELRAGEKLLLEALSTRFQTGMSPLREALARLVGDSLVVTEGQRGFWVAPLSAEEFEDITRVRGLVEAEALFSSIQRGDEAWAERVRSAYAALSEVEGRMHQPDFQAEEFEEANREFHEAINSACGSPWLLNFVSALNQHSERYRRIALSSASPARSVHDEHEALVEAVLARNGLKACRILDLHLKGTADVVRSSLLAHPDPAQAKR